MSVFDIYHHTSKCEWCFGPLLKIIKTNYFNIAMCMCTCMFIYVYMCMYNYIIIIIIIVYNNNINNMKKYRIISVKIKYHKNCKT